MTISMIAAIEINLGIGKDNMLPWHIPNDLKHFKNITNGHTVVMGRKTYESIGKPLPNRTNIVLSRTHPEWSLQLILDTAKQNDVFIIGGSEIYNLFMPYADKLYLTLIHKNYECDKFFPNFFHYEWECTSAKHIDDESVPYTFATYERKSPS